MWEGFGDSILLNCSRSISLPGFMFVSLYCYTSKSGDAFAQDCSVSVGFVCTVGAIVFI